MVRFNNTEVKSYRLERSLDGNCKELVGTVKFVGREKEYAHQGQWGHDSAIKKFMVIVLQDGTEQKVMAETCYIHFYFEHVQSTTTYENVTEIQVGNTVVIEVGPNFQGKEFIHTNRIFKVDMNYVMERARENTHVEETKLEPGVYKTPDGRIYVVKFNKDKTRLYAKKLVESGFSRLNEEGEKVAFDFEYEAGAIYNIRAEHRMSEEEGRKLMVRYGRCIVCGRHLKDAKSVEKGMGPVCRKYFKEA